MIADRAYWMLTCQAQMFEVLIKSISFWQPEVMHLRRFYCQFFAMYTHEWLCLAILNPEPIAPSSSACSLLRQKSSLVLFFPRVTFVSQLTFFICTKILWAIIRMYPTKPQTEKYIYFAYIFLNICSWCCCTTQQSKKTL